MIVRGLKDWMPRSLYWRAALILLVPVMTILLVVTVVFIQRLYEDDEDFDAEAVENGTTERQMRNQFNAWVKFMTMDTGAQEAAE